MTVAILEVAAPSTRYADVVDRLVRQRDRLTNAQARAMLRLLADVRRRLLDDLTRAAGGGSTYQAWQRGQLRQAVEDAAAGLVRRAGAELQDDLRQAWEAGSAFQPTALAAAGVMLTPRAISVDQLLVAQELAGSLVTRLGSDALTQLNRLVTLGVVGSVPVGRLMSQVAAVLRTQPTRAAPRLGSIAYQAERVVRNEMLSVFAMADEVRVADVADQVPGLLKVWDAVGDERTRPDHGSAGRRYDEAGAIPIQQDFVVGGHRAARPHDPRLPASQTVMCRCVRRLWSPEWAD